VTRSGWDNWPARFWGAQLILNFLSPKFFSLHVIGMALGIIGLMLLAIVGFIASAFTRDRLAAAFFVPYAAWVSFALALNAAIWRLSLSLSIGFKFIPVGCGRSVASIDRRHLFRRTGTPTVGR